MSGDRLTPSGYVEFSALFDALSHPMRIKIMGELAVKRRYVSEMAKILNISRALLYMHFKKLEDANIITSDYEISQDGKTMKYYEAKDFIINITPQLMINLSKSIPTMQKTGEN
ncbi:MAG: winged helix-turn-helix domain-containing protein [Defluviitaleaceae bacterium]|nr:winged helix-turn-helix domain-containing protein [Defluviitaleaceae bacterium]